MADRRPLGFAAAILFSMACYVLWNVGVAGNTWGDGGAFLSLFGFLLLFPLAIFVSALAGNTRLGQVLF